MQMQTNKYTIKNTNKKNPCKRKQTKTGVYQHHSYIGSILWYRNVFFLSPSSATHSLNCIVLHSLELVLLCICVTCLLVLVLFCYFMLLRKPYTMKWSVISELESVLPSSIYTLLLPSLSLSFPPFIPLPFPTSLPSFHRHVNRRTRRYHRPPARPSPPSLADTTLLASLLPSAPSRKRDDPSMMIMWRNLRCGYEHRWWRFAELVVATRCINTNGWWRGMSKGLIFMWVSDSNEWQKDP